MQIKNYHIAMFAGAVAVGVMTFIFDVTPLDLVISKAFFFPLNPVHFPIGSLMPWAWFNANENDLTVVLYGIALFLLLVGLARPRFRPFIVYALFIVAAGIVGPELIVNFLLKGEMIGGIYIGWSRPRPYQIAIFGGTEPFYYVWQPAFLAGLKIPDSSFPSGHVVTGSIFIVIYLVFNNTTFIAAMIGGVTKRKVIVLKTVKYGGLVAAVFLGSMLTIARISAGAHFASDCMYSFVFTWFPSAILYYWVFNIPKLEQKAMKNYVLGAPAA
jgi:membrane-associated PAP2 superfamily phosphatase